MIVAALTALVLGVAAERRALEDIARRSANGSWTAAVTADPPSAPWRLGSSRPR